MILNRIGLLTTAFVALLSVTAPVGAGAGSWDFTPALLPPADARLLHDDRPALAAPATGLMVGRWFDADSSLGVGVARFGSTAFSGLDGDVGPGTPYRLLDPSLPTTAISLDLTLAWPAKLEPSADASVQPYVSFGPALLLAERARLSNPLATPADVRMQVGVKAGAGLTWHVDRHAALFGEYRLTRGVDDPFGVAGRGGPSAALSGYDLLYGLRLKF